MIPFVTTGAAKISNALECPDNPQKIPLPLGGFAPHLIHGSVGPAKFIQNGMSIGSVVFAQRTIGCPITLQ